MPGLPLAYQFTLLPFWVPRFTQFYAGYRFCHGLVCTRTRCTARFLPVTRTHCTPLHTFGWLRDHLCPVHTAGLPLHGFCLRTHRLGYAFYCLPRLPAPTRSCLPTRTTVLLPWFPWILRFWLRGSAVLRSCVARTLLGYVCVPDSRCADSAPHLGCHAFPTRIARWILFVGFYTLDFTTPRWILDFAWFTRWVGLLVTRYAHAVPTFVHVTFTVYRVRLHVLVTCTDWFTAVTDLLGYVRFIRYVSFGYALDFRLRSRRLPGSRCTPRRATGWFALRACVLLRVHATWFCTPAVLARITLLVPTVTGPGSRTLPRFLCRFYHWFCSSAWVTTHTLHHTPRACAYALDFYAHTLPAPAAATALPFIACHTPRTHHRSPFSTPLRIFIYINNIDNDVLICINIAYAISSPHHSCVILFRRATRIHTLLHTICKLDYTRLVCATRVFCNDIL